MAKQLYGVEWATDDEVIINLTCYAATDERRAKIPGVLSKAEHFTRAIKLLLPEPKSGEEGLRWHYWIDDLIAAWCERDIHTVWGPSSSGKSAIIGLLAYVDLLASPKKTYTCFVTDKLASHDTRAWSNVLKFRGMMAKKYQIGRIVNSTQQKRLLVDAGGQAAGIYCISTEKGDSFEDLKKKLGAHNERTRLVVDEAQACGASVLELKRNLGQGTKSYKETFIGNPDAWSNPLGQHGEPYVEVLRDVEGGDEGLKEMQRAREMTTLQHVTRWDTVQEWNGLRGVCLVLDSRNSPACASPAEAARLFFLPTQASLANQAAMSGGEDSPAFWTLAIGRISPMGGRTTALSPLDFMNLGIGSARPWATGPREVFMSVDTSLGVDDVSMVRIEVGPVQMGVVAGNANSSTAAPVIIAQVTAKAYAVVNAKEGDVSGQIAHQVVAKRREWKIEPRNCGVESGGQQGHVIDTIERIDGTPGQWVRVNPAGPATERVIAIQVREGRVLKRETARDRYNTKAAELVLNAVQLMRQGVLCGQALRGPIEEQLTTRGIEQINGKTDLQDKRSWIREHKGKSPDEMDAMCVGVEMILQRGLLSLLDKRVVAEPTAKNPFGWMDRHRARGGAGAASKLVRKW
jgi:hypothetical protein